MTATVDPIAEFLALFERAKREEKSDATAAALATADLAARPSVRVVLLKHVDERGFVFFTNYESRKAKDLEANPQAALCVYWPSLERQFRAEGSVEELTGDESNAYFSTRPRGSQIGAWTSKQSAPLASRRELVARYMKIQARFAGQEVPRPEFWGGYRLKADRIEIWHNQLHRLHDRFVYLKQDDQWTQQRLYP